VDILQSIAPPSLLHPAALTINIFFLETWSSGKDHDDDMCIMYVHVCARVHVCACICSDDNDTYHSSMSLSLMLLLPLPLPLPLSLPLSMSVSVWVSHSLVLLSLGGECHNNVLNFVLEDFLLILNRGHKIIK